MRQTLKMAFVELIVSLTVFFCIGSNVGVANESTEILLNNTSVEQPLYILSLLPYPDPEAQPSFTEGPTLTLAAQLAVNLINNSTDILSGYNLELVSGDSGCNIRSKAALVTGTHIVSTDKPVAGVVGPGCSSSALFVAPIISRDQIGLITVHIAGSLLLSNRDSYSNSFGTLDSTEVFVDALLALSQRNMWQNVTVLFDESRPYYLTTLRALKDRLNSLNGPINVVLSSAVYETYIPIQEIKDSGSRIVFLLVGPDTLSNILCLGYHRGVFFDTYQWVVVSRTREEIKPLNFTYDGIEYSCNEEQMMTAINKSIFIHYRLDPFNFSETTDSGLSYTQFSDLYTKSVETYNIDLEDGEETIQPSFWAASYFDAVWSLALALNNSKEEVKNRTGLDLSEYRYGHSNATDIIRNNLLQLDFEGVSGRITFDNASGYVNRAVDIYQVLNDTMILVEYFNCTDVVQFGDLSLDYISDSVSLTLTRAPLWVGVIFMLIAIIGLILLIVTQAFIIAYRNYHSVKANSPRILHVAFVGCYLMNFTSICYIIVESFDISARDKCNLFQTLNTTSMVGIALIFGSISGKTWRLYRIFVHYLDPGMLITDRVLFVYIGILVLIQTPVLIAWAVVEPQSPFDQLYPEEGVYTIRCITPYFIVWFGSLVAYNYCIVTICFILALLCHRIPQRDFKTNSILILVYLLTVDLVIGFPLYFLLPVSSNILPEFFVLSVTLILIYLFSLVFLFWTPLWPIFKEKMGPYFKPFGDVMSTVSRLGRESQTISTHDHEL